MSSARRPLLTATAAGTLLGALWFVPSANASQDEPARTEVTQQARATTAVSTAESSQTGDGTRLADTGSFDTTPYVVGGTAFLALGAGFVVYSVRRERLGF
ncbi:LPXTG cell wall anchor domain-containing protein [Streptomyces sp. NPDC046909]|uniref:LPXTG cell wall anchor domain-containing protein n=1 Tax=Streptomyces sp. NPDC046909 TaxID=3155617 RepID=UPI0033D337B6